MPNPTMDKLKSDSSEQMIRDAIQSEIEMCMKTPPPEGAENHQKYCAGKAYGMARERTGKELK